MSNHSHTESLAQWIPLQTHSDARGSLVIAEGNREIPFAIARVYYLFGSAPATERGFHAHKELTQVAVCVAGSCTMILDNGSQREAVHLDSPARGLLIRPGLWREMKDFSPNCVLLVFASATYDEADYIRDYETFKTYAQAANSRNAPTCAQDKNHDCLKMTKTREKIEGRNITLRDIEIDDATFVLGLRLDAIKSKFINPVEPDLQKQIDYIKSYKASGNSWYFIIEDKHGEALGTVRIYDIQADSFCWGSWIVKDGAVASTALESALLIYEYAFNTLCFKKSHFSVNKENFRVLAFHERMGATRTSENEAEYFYHYNKESYEAIRPKYQKWLPVSDRPENW